MPDSVATRVLGGSPLTVLLRLGTVSLIVGALMSWLGIDALDLVDEVERAVAHLYGSGFAALHDVGRTVLAGAAIVLPVWLVLRLLSVRGPRDLPIRDAPRVDPPDEAHVTPDAPYPGAPRWSKPERRR